MVFIVGRAIQGCGAAGILQGALVIITKTVPLAQRPFYISIVISAFGLCVKIGPLLGGVFTEHASWRWCFWMLVSLEEDLGRNANVKLSNVPIGAVVLVLITIFLKLDSQAKTGSSSRTWIQIIIEIDFAGMVLVIALICCLLLGVQRDQQSLPWSSPKVVGLLVGSGLMFILFIIIQWKMGDRATLPFSILRRRSIISGALYLFTFAMPTYVVSLLRLLSTTTVNKCSMASIYRFTSNPSEASVL